MTRWNFHLNLSQSVRLDRKCSSIRQIKIFSYKKKSHFPFSRFDVDSTEFFNQSTSIAVVQFILERQRFSDDDESHNNVGIEKLLADGVYQASYPLHDVRLNQKKSLTKINGNLFEVCL